MGSAVQDEPADKSAPTQCRNYRSPRDLPSPWRVEGKPSRLILQRKFRQVIQRHGANDLETLGTDFIQRIIRGVPPGVIKINDIDRWNPNGVQWCVIIDEVTVQVAKVVS